MKVVIALGSNLGDREDLIQRAIDAVRKLVTVERVSSLIETDPVGGPEQGKYLNGVLIGTTHLQPVELMEKLLEIESRLGRVRTVANAPRTIDLDLIDCDGLLLDTPTLQLPHPRAHLRPFVILPWLEIAPEGVLVGHGTLREIARGL